MIKKSIKRLQFICDNIPALLSDIGEDDFCSKPAPGKWSKKEILGHLIDSATNNHHRIVKGQFEQRPKITYDNHVWNQGNHYDRLTVDQVISFWTAYNGYLLELIKLVPNEKLLHEVETGEQGEKAVMTVAFVIEDYVDHLEYHLRQIVEFE